MKKTVIIDGNNLTIENLYKAAVENHPVSFPQSDDFWNKLRESRSFFESYMEKGYPIYGVTTGFGDSCHNQINHKKSAALQKALIAFHGVGVGGNLDPIAGKAVLLCRLNSNVKGYSAIRPELAKLMLKLAEKDIIPVIPQIGSVGASGDLTPLSYLGAVLMGERKVYYKGSIVPAIEAFKEENIQPLELQAKEGLAIMNGTSVMTAIAALSWYRIGKLANISDFITAATSEILQAKEIPFRAKVSEIKNHPGQIQSAEYVLNIIKDSKRVYHYDALLDQIGTIREEHFKKHDIKIQDRYSIRCAPHINGVLRDTLHFTKNWIENEINSANDNPLIDSEEQTIYNTGNFYGGHISLACDYLRIALANTSDLSEKQAEIIIDGKFNNLTENLIPFDDAESSETQGLRHGFKAAQISISAISAEIQHLSAPVSVHSRPTESLNQDKVSMGTISARKLSEMTELMFLQSAIHLMAVCQAMDLIGTGDFSPFSRKIYEKVREFSSFVEDDRPLDEEIRKTADFLKNTDLF